MAMKEIEPYDVGVIVGRFQVPELHQAHRELIEHVTRSHNKTVIFLGLSPLTGTRENPLDFESRKQMILKQFPDVNVLYIKDHPSDDAWARRLDEMVGDVLTPTQTAVLYGGRDSFINHYPTKKFATRELTQDVWVSGSEMRKDIAKRSTKASPDFRAGAVWAAFCRYPMVITTVDVAIYDWGGTKVLLGRKQNETKFRFIGGFSDPRCASFEEDANRELFEETGLSDVGPLEFLGSFAIDDWRYRSEVDTIRTMFYATHVVSGTPKAADDIAEVRWFDIDKLTPDDVVYEHQVLLKQIL